MTVIQRAMEIFYYYNGKEPFMSALYKADYRTPVSVNKQLHLQPVKPINQVA
jgi:hypothetical protein